MISLNAPGAGEPVSGRIAGKDHPAPGWKYDTGPEYFFPRELGPGLAARVPVFGKRGRFDGIHGIAMAREKRGHRGFGVHNWVSMDRSQAMALGTHPTFQPVSGQIPLRGGVVRGAGIEPARDCSHRILSPGRLPVPPPSHLISVSPFCRRPRLTLPPSPSASSGQAHSARGDPEEDALQPPSERDLCKGEGVFKNHILSRAWTGPPLTLPSPREGRGILVFRRTGKHRVMQRSPSEKWEYLRRKFKT